MRNNSKTIRERGAYGTLREIETEQTIRQETHAHTTMDVLSLPHFYGYTIRQALPTHGMEADLYLLEKNGELFILKLYRNAITPHQGVLNTVRKLSHDNPHQLVLILDVGLDKQTGRWYELMEYIPYGSLNDISLKGLDRPALVYAMLRDLTESIHLLHRHGVIHRDIKPSNILIRSVNPLDLILTDFGISSQIVSGSSLKMTAIRGTPLYWAPETFNNLVAPATDWWSLGVIALEFLTGKHPFEAFNAQQITYRLTTKNIEIPPFINEEAQLLKGLLTKDIEKRWGYIQIKEWLSGNRNIPVYYEEFNDKLATTADNDRIPFRFERNSLFTLKAIASEFASSEHHWLLGIEYLPYVRTWLEAKREFDQAIDFAKQQNKYTEDHFRLFHFIHSHCSLPFIFMGKEITPSNLLRWTFETSRHDNDLSPAEQAIVQLIDNGTLFDLFLSHCRYRNFTDIHLKETIILMQNTPQPLRSAYAHVLLNPTCYFWPCDARSDTIFNLSQIGRIPLEKDWLKTLEREYILPEEALRLLETNASYTQGAEMLSQMHNDHLLVKKNCPQIPSSHLNSKGQYTQDTETYINIAKTTNWDMDDALAASIARLCIAIQMEGEKTGAVNDSSNIVARLQGIRNKKVTSEDRSFITEIEEAIHSIRPKGISLRAFLYSPIGIYAPILIVGIISLIVLFYPIPHSLVAQTFYYLCAGGSIFFVFLYFVMTRILSQEYDSMYYRADPVLGLLGFMIILFIHSDHQTLQILYDNIYILHFLKYLAIIMFFFWSALRWHRFCREYRKNSFLQAMRKFE